MMNKQGLILLCGAVLGLAGAKFLMLPIPSAAAAEAPATQGPPERLKLEIGAVYAMETNGNNPSGNGTGHRWRAKIISAEGGSWYRIAELEHHEAEHQSEFLVNVDQLVFLAKASDEKFKAFP